MPGKPISMRHREKVFRSMSVMNPLKTSRPASIYARLAALTALALPGSLLSAAEINLDINLQGPPPPRREVVVEQGRPGPDYVWVEGYWDGAPGRYTWVGGHWDRPPHPGMRWSSPRWERDHDGHYRQVRGGWQR